MATVTELTSVIFFLISKYFFKLAFSIVKYVLNNIPTRSIAFSGEIFGLENGVCKMSESESVVASKLTYIIAYWFCFDKADSALVTNLSEVSLN